ncbi:hypothetical protein OBBRIDRAFT_740471 [Obba rivulosa]|uniref:Mmc1 C-terminal domain-containing protein n=1 Tax=Obba rivulosa TaxID=1052685 RepID=A0A8E2AIE7_9APHY|nr:hypothetical protein OBBRIDRAFT_740471 [Obba rivulosa]
MQTCLVVSSRAPSLSALHQRNCQFASAVVHVPSSRRCRRAASTAVAYTTRAPTEELSAPRQETLTVLHKTTSLLPRVLPQRHRSPTEPECLEFWDELLNEAYNDLSVTPGAKVDDRVRLAVCGLDDLSESQARDLVTALLEDPFASEAQKEAIRSRWQSVPEDADAISIQWDHYPTAHASLQVRSAWLQQLPAPVQLVELRSTSRPPPPSASTKTLFTADIPVIVCNPAFTSLDTLVDPAFPQPLPLTHPHAILVVTTLYSAELGSRIKACFPDTLTVLFIDPSRALTALSILSAAPSSPIAVQRYQDDFDGSRISSLTHSIRDVLSARTDPPSRSPAAVLHVHTAQANIAGSLAACRSFLTRALREIDGVCLLLSGLKVRIEEAKVKVPREVFGAASEGADEVQAALDKARRDIGVVMDALTWWKLLWRVDDLAEVVNAAVERVWCKDLEQKLIFHAGRLASLQEDFTKSSKDLLASFPPTSPFHSPVLENTLSRISTTPAYLVDAATLAAPLKWRRQQLSFPTTRLHLSAQRAMFGMGGSVLGSMGAVWAGWVGHLGLLDIGLQPETAVGLGLLGGAAGVRWAIARFEKAKRKWWKDWGRVSEGLGRDLRAALDKTMEEKVLVVPAEACRGLKDLTSRRKDQIDELMEEVAGLETDLARVTSESK